MNVGKPATKAECWKAAQVDKFGLAPAHLAGLSIWLWSCCHPVCFWSDSGTPETTQTQKGDAQGGAQVSRREREVEEGVAHEAKSVICLTSTCWFWFCFVCVWMFLAMQSTFCCLHKDTSQFPLNWVGPEDLRTAGEIRRDHDLKIDQKLNSRCTSLPQCFPSSCAFICFSGFLTH